MKISKKKKIYSEQNKTYEILAMYDLHNVRKMNIYKSLRLPSGVYKILDIQGEEKIVHLYYPLSGIFVRARVSKEELADLLEMQRTQKYLTKVKERIVRPPRVWVCRELQEVFV